MLININKDKYVIKDGIDDKEVYSTKIVDALPEDFNDYHWQYISGELVKKEHVYVKTLDDFKADKLAELETYIAGLKETGVIYNDKPFKCDDLASSRINKIVNGISIGASPFPLTWITRNSEQGTIVFNTKEEFLGFYSAFSNYELEIQVKEATFKMQIELAQSKEELDAIVFEDVEEENVTE